MSDANKFIAGLLLGAVAGAALAVFLKTEKGQELVSDVKEETDHLQEELKTKLRDFDTAVNQLLEKGKTFVEDLERKARQATS